MGEAEIHASDKPKPQISDDQYRIEFIEGMEAGKQIATICNITELSNHYK